MDQHMPSRLPLELPAALLDVRDPCVAFRFGRGRTGGTTWLDVVIQFALASNRTVLVGDADRRNPTLSGIYPPGAPVSALPPPVSDETADVKDFLTDAVGQAIRERRSLVIDMSGGDRAMQEYGRDLGMVELCEAHSIRPLAFFSCGPEMDDFDHIVSIWRAGYFRPAHSLLILNEHLIQQGRTTLGAFDPILARPEFDELGDAGMMPFFMPRLPCMAELRKGGFSLLDAATGGPGAGGVPLDPVRQFMVRQFLTKLLQELRRVGALGWLP